MRTVPELADLPGHLHLGLRARRDHRAGAGGRRRRLHRQALFADRTHGADPGGPAPAGGARPVRARGPRHRLRPAAGHRGRAPGGADGDRVRAPARAGAGRWPGPDPRDGGAGAPAEFARRTCALGRHPPTSPCRRRRTFRLPVAPTRANVDGRRLPAAATTRRTRVHDPARNRLDHPR